LEIPFPATLSRSLSDFAIERGLLVKMEATAGKKMLRKISARVAGFSTLSEKVGDKVKVQSPQLIDSSGEKPDLRSQCGGA